MNSIDYIENILTGSANDFDLDPRGKLLALFFLSLVCLYIKSMPVLYIYLFTLILSILNIRSIRRPSRKIFMLTGLQLIFSMAFYLYGRSFNSYHSELIAVSRVLVRMLILYLLGYLFITTTELPRFIKSLECLHLPFCIVFVLSIAIRFFPLMINEVKCIWEQSRWKGLCVKQFLRHPLQATRAILFPVVIRMLRVADNLSLSATARGFGHPADRTILHSFRFKNIDIVFMIIVLTISVSFVAMGFFI
ncbi:energy-coupling factor transporter transmembrane protein EcfT [bacterium]|nr:energy-coupling factor transporter transmembrane protein EcfT [bacterium]